MKTQWERASAGFWLLLVLVLCGCGGSTGAGTGRNRPGDSGTAGTGGTGNGGGTGGAGIGGQGGAGGAGTAGASGATNCAFSPCGGDLVGTWTPSLACPFSETGTDPQCPTARVDANLTTTGDVVFGSDGTYAVNLTLSGTVRTTLPASCLGGMDCATFSDPTVACSPTADGCVCTQTVPAAANSITGTYAVSGNTATLSPSDGSTPVVDTFCVQNGVLKLRSSTGSLIVLE